MVDIPIIVRCQEHGYELKLVGVTGSRGLVVVEVEPCAGCVQAAYDKGELEGVEDPGRDRKDPGDKGEE